MTWSTVSDWRAEFEFLESCFEKHAEPVVESVFEPACGTGRLLFRFAKAGYGIAGNDLNAKSVEFCNRRLERHDLSGSVVVGDMTDFELAEPVHSAFNTINSFRHLMNQRQAMDHLKCMEKAICPGGIYVLGLHLSPLEGETCDGESWSASRGHLTVNSRLWLDERNLAERYEAYNMTFDVYTPTDQFQIRDQVRFRTYTAAQFTGMIDQLSHFDIEAVYDFSYEIDQAINLDEGHEDVVFVLKRN